MIGEILNFLHFIGKQTVTFSKHYHKHYSAQYTCTCDATLQQVKLVVIHSFISGMHHYEFIAPNVDINLQSGRF